MASMLKCAGFWPKWAHIGMFARQAAYLTVGRSGLETS
ncbi:hypothetical protein MM1S1540310_1442 [Mycobacteroides abscessus subsp. bolletii 1S-154-0310]|uniref:Uncharacterized protein n=1 Tax=Mycobacteroides abscessus 1948 TaxID=1299323 RepID=A0A829QBK6_9MYCO|nr:hypothetical protein MA6G0125R_1100 [Mycobacteroides abscessus 6G-0125-R]EIU49425.1 hypothetical protein MA6G0125S_2073 [Mycobacteroides abscessus 6G-0125-S]EIU54939.1 hypothetical protein MA6G0728S_5176 [Mycobacteroides abscessus 6G-0728-S]EIU61292.1 hypothetical protein MA6G1108_2063 [Mycobacteroides abscessus 6G-1108]EIU61558.1 hypothetical protein MM1S1510930_1884 [Mycobacteroides abscessus subsp. bolletii 1S-151-0930]EIU69824.1 hypothetical protein MM1S1520914_2092 [Mycobacteroides abs